MTTLQQVEDILQTFARTHDEFRLRSITDQPKAFNNFLAEIRIKRLEATLINDRDQIFISIHDGSKYDVDFSSVVEFESPEKSAADYNSQLFKRKWPQQIPIILEDAFMKADAIADILDRPSFRQEYDKFLAERSRKMFQGG